MKNSAELLTAITELRKFIPPQEIDCMIDGLRGEESEYFRTKLIETAEVIRTMPKTYEQDGKGEEVVVYLHYFRGQMDWYITERDKEVVQSQAFGFADLGFGDGPEAGYISIVELLQNGIELDLHFTPRTWKEVREKREAA